MLQAFANWLGSIDPNQFFWVLKHVVLPALLLALLLTLFWPHIGRFFKDVYRDADGQDGSFLLDPGPLNKAVQKVNGDFEE